MDEAMATSSSSGVEGVGGEEERHAARLQALCRRWAARRRYKKLLSRCKHRTNVAREMLSTEETYLKSLQMMTEAYVKPLSKAAEEGADPKVTELNAMISKIEYIIGVNMTLWNDLKQRVAEWSHTQCVGDIFIKMGPFLKMYAQYTNNYESASKLLEQSANDKDNLWKLIQKCHTARPDALTFESYLIMPIQRIPRYNLLLEDMIAHTWPDHVDYETLCKALKLMQEVAEYVNKDLETSSALQKIISIQNALGGEVQLVAPHRTWLKDGRLVSMRFGTYFLSNYVWVYLLNDMLIFATRLLASYRYRGKFDLYATSVVDLPDTNAFKNILQVKCVGKETWTLSASSSSEKAAWVEAINNAIEEVLNANPTERAKREELELSGAIKLERPRSASQGGDGSMTPRSATEDAKNFTLQMIIQAASEQQQRSQQRGQGSSSGSQSSSPRTPTLRSRSGTVSGRDGGLEEDDFAFSLSEKERARLVRLGVLDKDENEEADLMKATEEARNEFSFIQRGIHQRQAVYLQSVKNSNTSASKVQAEEIERRKAEMRNISRVGSVRDSLFKFEPQLGEAGADVLVPGSPRSAIPRARSAQLPKDTASKLIKANEAAVVNRSHTSIPTVESAEAIMSPRGQRGSKPVTEEIQQRIIAYQSATKSESPPPSSPNPTAAQASTAQTQTSPISIEKKKPKAWENGARRSISSGQTAEVLGGGKAKEEKKNKSTSPTNAYGATGEPNAGVVTSDMVKERRTNFQDGTEDQPLLKPLVVPHYGNVENKGESCRCILY